MTSDEIGPDSKFSWIMVIGCFIINSVTYGMIRSQGVYYLNVIGNYNVSRAEASWPFSICVGLTSLNGPLAGALCQRYGSRRTVMAGIVLAALGMALAFFADSIPELIAYVGVIHGFGLGLCMTPVPITINQYFVKHRATAQGVAFSGSTIMSFALPALLTYFADEYGLRGAFLLGGGIVLNGAIGGIIIKTPPWLSKKTKTPPADRTSTNIVAAAILASERMSNVVGPASPSLSTKKGKGSGIAWESAKQNEQQTIEIQSPDSQDLVDQELEAEEAKYGAHYKPVDPVDDVFDTNQASLRGQRRQHKPSHIMAMDSQSIRRISSSSNAPPQAVTSDLFRPERQNKVLESRVKKIALAIVRKFGGACNGFLDIAKHPMSVIIGLSWASFMFVFLTYNLIITDFVKDQGISEADSVYLYTAFSAGDLVGRLGLGWVTDKGFLKRRTFVAAALAMMGALVLCQPFLGDNYVLLLATSAFLGTIVGSTLVLFFVLYAEYLRPDQVAMAIGLNTAFNGAIMFARPVTVGFFRDALGSYSYLFYTLGGLQIGIASLWFLEPIIMRRMRPEPPKQEIATIS